MTIPVKPAARKGTIPAQSFKAACEHLEALDRDPLHPICVRVIAETDAAKAFVADPDNHPVRFRYRGPLKDLFDELKRRNDNGFAVYYVLNETDGKGTKLANFTRVLAVPLDLDGAPLPDIWRGGLKPHLIIESSPGKYQCIFNIVPTKDFKAAKAIAQRLAATYGGDPKVCDTPRVLRLAGFKHQKGDPFVSRIISSNPFDDPYTLAQLDKVLKKLPPSKPRAHGPAGAGKMDRDGAAFLLDELDPADVVPDNDKWQDFAMAAKVACADSDAEGYVLEWFARDGAHDPDEAEHRWDSFDNEKEGGIGVGTFIMFLKDNGVSNSKIQTVFGDHVDAAEDFDDLDGDDDDAMPWDDLKTTPKKTTKDKTYHTSGGLVYQIASDIKPEAIKWLWENRIARGKLNFLAGPADQGKSQITCDLVARVTNGTTWPNNEGKITPDDHGSVILLSAEDSAADTLWPRLKAAGADMDKVFIVQMMVRPLKDKAARMFNLAEDIAKLTELIRANPTHTFKLCVIDPINSYMGAGGRNGTDTFKTSEVRAVLSPLGDWSEKQDIATLFLSHLAKGSGKNSSPLHRMLDSQAFTAICRCGWFVAPEMKDKAETGRKFFVKGKANVGAPVPGLTYEIEAVQVEHDDVVLPKVPRITWTGTTDKSSGQAFEQMDNGGAKTSKVTLSEAAETFIRDELAGGPKDLGTLKARAEEQGHTWRNVRREASLMGVKSDRKGFGADRVTTWTLPAEIDDGFDNDDEGDL